MIIIFCFSNILTLLINDISAIFSYSFFQLKSLLVYHCIGFILLSFILFFFFKYNQYVVFFQLGYHAYDFLTCLSRNIISVWSYASFLWYIALNADVLYTSFFL